MNKNMAVRFTACAAIVAASMALADDIAKYDRNGRDWPVARRFDGDHVFRVALPMGGIG